MGHERCLLLVLLVLLMLQLEATPSAVGAVLAVQDTTTF